MTLVLMLAAALLSDKFYFTRTVARFPTASFLFFILFGPISFLLWRKENLRDHSGKDLLKFCWSGVAALAGSGIPVAIVCFWLEDPSSLREHITESPVWAGLIVLLVLSAVFVTFVLLTFLRLAMKHGLSLLFGTSEEG